MARALHPFGTRGPAVTSPPAHNAVGSSTKAARISRAIGSELCHRRDQTLDIVGTREAVIAVLDQREHYVVAGDARGEFDRVAPWHVGIGDALQDAHRTAGLDHAAEEQMLAPFLDQGAGDEVGPLRVGGGPLPRAFLENLRSEEHTSELQSLRHLVCSLLLEKEEEIHI